MSEASARKFGRPDYDSTIRVRSIPADEPLFVLRAQDQVAADTVRAWAALAAKAGAAPPVLELALKQADAMDAWPRRKLPDAGDLSDAERLQLTYAFDRRAQRAGVDLDPDAALKLLMAERRGYAHALAALRVMVRALEVARGVVRDGCVGIAETSCRLDRDTGEPIRPAPDAEHEAAIRELEAILAQIDEATAAGARALARTGAATQAVDHAERVSTPPAERQTAPRPEPGLGPIATTLLVSAWGVLIYGALTFAADRLLGWSLKPVEFLIGLALAVCVVNVANALVDIHLMRATITPPTQTGETPAASGTDEAQG